MCGSDIFLGIIAIIFPPLAVWVKRGVFSADSLINIALCCLGFLPGLLHAWYIISVTPDPTYEELEDAEQGRVTYYYVAAAPPRAYGAVRNSSNSGSSQPQTQPRQQQPQHQPGPSQGADDVPPTYAQVVGDNKVQNNR